MPHAGFHRSRWADACPRSAECAPTANGRRGRGNSFTFPLHASYHKALVVPLSSCHAAVASAVQGSIACGSAGGGNARALRRETLPNRCCARSTGVRSARVRAVASGSSTAISFRPSTPSINSRDMGPIMLRLLAPPLPRSLPADPSAHPAISSMPVREISNSFARSRKTSRSPR
jgi:hypothetical protein